MKMMTFDRRRIRMSLEGWYFAFVLTFIGTAAILRRANLLLILAAMLTAPLLFNWRFVMASLRGLFLKRRVPQLVVAGQRFRISLTIGNESPMDAWHVRIDESIHPRDSDQEMSVSVVVDRVPFENETTRGYECLIPHRGVYEISPARISTSYPLGLIEASATIDNRESLLVGPEPGELTALWREWNAPDEVDEPRSAGSQGILDGMFHAIREFRQGDSQRSIHWRSTAKLGKPAVKQYERQSDRELNLVAELVEDADPSASQSVEMVLSFVATVIHQACTGGRCEINVLLIGDRIDQHRGAATASLLPTINASLARIRPGTARTIETALESFTATRKVRGPVMVVSNREPAFAERAVSERVGRKQRSAPAPSHFPFPPLKLNQAQGTVLTCHWINVRDKDFELLFIPPPSLSGSASPSDSLPKLQENR